MNSLVYSLFYCFTLRVKRPRPQSAVIAENLHFFFCWIRRNETSEDVRTRIASSFSSFLVSNYGRHLKRCFHPKASTSPNSDHRLIAEVKLSMFPSNMRICSFSLWTEDPDVTSDSEWMTIISSLSGFLYTFCSPYTEAGERRDDYNPFMFDMQSLINRRIHYQNRHKNSVEVWAMRRSRSRRSLVGEDLETGSCWMTSVAD